MWTVRFNFFFHKSNKFVIYDKVMRIVSQKSRVLKEKGHTYIFRP